MTLFFEIIVISVLIWAYALLSERAYYRRKLEQERERHRNHVMVIEADHARQIRERVTTTLVRKDMPKQPLPGQVYFASERVPLPVLAIDDLNTDNISTDRITKEPTP